MTRSDSNLWAEALKASRDAAQSNATQQTPQKVAVPTDMSGSADGHGKILKKAKVDASGMARDLFNAETLPSTPLGSSGLGDTGAGPDELCQLRSENAQLKEEVEMLRQELHLLSLADKGPTAAEPSDEAARKRLERICKANAQGSHGCVCVCVCF